MSRYQKGETNLDFTEARDSDWQWHQLGHLQVCTSLQTDNHASTPPLSFLQAGCPSCRPTNSAKALKATATLFKNSYTVTFTATAVFSCRSSAAIPSVKKAHLTPLVEVLLCYAVQPIVLTGNPLIRVIRGSLASEVHVMFPMVQHVLRISNSTGLRVHFNSFVANF